jgi:hypothetical protein
MYEQQPGVKKLGDPDLTEEGRQASGGGMEAKWKEFRGFLLSRAFFVRVGFLC